MTIHTPYRADALTHRQETQEKETDPSDYLMLTNGGKDGGSFIT